MRVALFTECYRPVVNGVVVSVVTFARELRKLGHEVQIIAPAYPKFADREPDVYRLPSIMPPTRAGYPLAIPYTGYRLRAAFASRPPDIIHAQHPFATGREARGWARRLGRPLVFTYHTLIREYAHYIPLPRPLVRAAAVRLSRTFANSADQVIVPTSGVGDLLRQYGVHKPIEVIPTGVDMSLVRAALRQAQGRPPQAAGHPERSRGAAAGKPMRATLGIPAGAPLIAYSGRIALEKSLDTLVKAFSVLVHRGLDAHLVLIGGGPWEEQCRRLVQEEGLAERVHTTGYVPRETVLEWLADADVYCFPSLTDTQGVAVLEAMAMGCPPVAARSGAVEDVIRQERDGLIVEPTAEALAGAIGRVLGDDGLRRGLAGEARRRAEEFSADRMARRLVGVYERLLSSARQ